MVSPADGEETWHKWPHPSGLQSAWQALGEPALGPPAPQAPPLLSLQEGSPGWAAGRAEGRGRKPTFGLTFQSHPPRRLNVGSELWLFRRKEGRKEREGAGRDGGREGRGKKRKKGSPLKRAVSSPSHPISSPFSTEGHFRWSQHL